MTPARFPAGCDEMKGFPEPGVTPALLAVTGRTGRRLTVAAERAPDAGSVSAVIGRSGGVLVLGRNALTVSCGAVTEPTMFTMVRDPEAPLRVRLTAGRNGRNDVGAAGFNAPVTLSLSFHRVMDAPRDSSAISIIHFAADGIVEELITEVRVTGKVATAELPHFSLFGLAWP